ncbi:ADP-ribose pyrophosphatase [Actinorhabdospora filicis]|uniref:ADP-ribose pyrophosphatase n=2 Tax=Actinorhabdospora filicis TaxID=1785913 RepID=A0A9W6SHC0_9ACTN|nr:ADP-ribose pyrophosphatase [Actinorhabdospora filicis]
MATASVPNDPAGYSRLMTDPVRALHDMAIELGAMVQNGLYYATDKYEIARYTRMREMTAEILALIADRDAADLLADIQMDRGHATPKVDVRAALFDGEDRVLLVREARDGRWCLPGGWVDALDLPHAAAEREFAEEAGLKVRTTKLAALHDGSVHNGHTGPWHVYKLLFLVERTDDADPVAGLDGETTDVRHFALDELPELSIGRTTAAQLELLLRHHREGRLATEVD